MPDIDTILPEDAVTQLPDTFSVEIAGLSDAGQTQVLDAIQAAHDDGSLATFDVDHAVTDAATADYDRSNVEALHLAQADAVADGDYAKADEIAHATQYQLQEVQDHGGSEESALTKSESDQDHLAWAQYHADTATEEAGWASDAAAHGDADHAAEYSEMAATHVDSAVAQAAPADEGGHYGDHSVDAGAAAEPAADASASAE